MERIIHIESKEFVELSAKLQRIGRADLPVAVRSTLNNLAFDMKGVGKRGYIQQKGEQSFDYTRNKTLLRAMTGVTKAQGLDINNMHSKAGIVNRPGKNDLAEGLEAQTKGGTVKSKSTPLDNVRTSKNIAKKVRKGKYISNLDAVDLRRTKGHRYHARAISAYKQKKPILVDGKGNTPLIGEIKRVKRTRGSIDYKVNWLYRINQSGKVNLSKKRPFIAMAANQAMKNMPNEFVKQAKKRIDKALKK